MIVYTELPKPKLKQLYDSIHGTKLISDFKAEWFRFSVFDSQERRYLLKEFPELVSCEENSKLLEVGCGNGSTVLPILR